MRDVLLDADAFRCLRELGLLEACLEAYATAAGVVLTEYVARHELSLVATDVARLARTTALRVEPVLRGSSAGQRFRAFRKQGHDKGEAEAIAWALEAATSTRPVFVTADQRATKLAKTEGVPVTDVLGLLIVAVERTGLDPSIVSEALTVWESAHSGRCRPREFRGFEVERSARRDTEVRRFT